MLRGVGSKTETCLTHWWRIYFLRTSALLDDIENWQTFLAVCPFSGINFTRPWSYFTQVLRQFSTYYCDIKCALNYSYVIFLNWHTQRRVCYLTCSAGSQCEHAKFWFALGWEWEYAIVNASLGAYFLCLFRNFQLAFTLLLWADYLFIYKIVFIHLHGV